MPADRVLVDTHVLLWWQAGGERLSRTARRRIEAADEVLVSPISCWEVAMLEGKGRVAFDRAVEVWCNDLFAPSRSVRPAALDHRVTVTAALLDAFHGDPADRIIVATAQHERVPLITKDERIRTYCDRSDRPTAIW